MSEGKLIAPLDQFAPPICPGIGTPRRGTRSRRSDPRRRAADWRETATPTSPSRQPEPRPPPPRRQLARNNHPNVTFSSARAPTPATTAPTGEKQPPQRHLLVSPSPDPRRHAADWRQTTTLTSPSRQHPGSPPDPGPLRPAQTALPATEPRQLLLLVAYMLGAGQLREFASPPDVESHPCDCDPY